MYKEPLKMSESRWSLVLGRLSRGHPKWWFSKGMPQDASLGIIVICPDIYKCNYVCFQVFGKLFQVVSQFFQLFSAGKMSSPQVMAIHKKCGSVLGGIHLEAVLGTLNDRRDLWKWEASSKQLYQICVLEFMSPYSYRHPVTPPEVRYGWTLTKTYPKH